MKKIDEIYNQAMEEIQNYNVDEAFNKIIGITNEKVSRKIEEFDIEFEKVAKNSVGKDKQRKKTGILKKFLALALLLSMVPSLVGCGNEKINEGSEVTLSPYDQIVNEVNRDFSSEVFNIGCGIGSKMSQAMSDSYYEGNLKIISDEDIIRRVANIVDGDNWYEYFDTNISIMTLEEINSQRYSVAETVYAGIYEILGEQLILEATLDLLIEKIIGKGVVLEYCEHFDDLIYNKVDRELTEDEKLNNLLLLARYYRAMANKEKETTLILS